MEGGCQRRVWWLCVFSSQYYALYWLGKDWSYLNLRVGFVSSQLSLMAFVTFRTPNVESRISVATICIAAVDASFPGSCGVESRGFCWLCLELCVTVTTFGVSMLSILFPASCVVESAAFLRRTWNPLSASRCLMSVCQNPVLWSSAASLAFIWNFGSASRRQQSLV